MHFLKSLLILTFSLFLMVFSCSSPGDDPATIKKYNIAAKKISGLYDTLGEPASNEWRACHKNEVYQSLESYIKKNPERPTETKNKIYIQPLGEFDTTKMKILNIAAEYLHAFFGLEVIMNPTIAASVIPAKARREWDGTVQLNSLFILKEFLKPNIPSDAAVFIAFTNYDLYPSDDWNFVFGQALTKGRVGVWSIYRYGYPQVNKKTFSEFLVRTLKTASHEIGHMFSVLHCVKYSCCMNGSNSLEESDKRTSALCPDCLTKLCWNFNIQPQTHLTRVRDFWKKYGYPENEKFYQQNLDSLGKEF